MFYEQCSLERCHRARQNIMSSGVQWGCAHLVSRIPPHLNKDLYLNCFMDLEGSSSCCRVEVTPAAQPQMVSHAENTPVACRKHRCLCHESFNINTQPRPASSLQSDHNQTVRRPSRVYFTHIVNVLRVTQQPDQHTSNQKSAANTVSLTL